MGKNLFVLLFLGTFPSIFFTLSLEQYVLGVFFLTLFLYSYIKKYNFSEIPFIGACGCLLTNVVLLPFWINLKKLKISILKLLNIFLDTLAIVFITGQSYLIMRLLSNLKAVFGYTNISNTITFKLMQYSVFVKNCFIANKGIVLITNTGLIHYVSQIPKSFDIVGIILLIIAIFSFILNRKDKIVKISFYWIVFSFLLLVIVGYGSNENGMILYTLYFSWAFIILIYKFIVKIFKNLPKLKNGIIILLILTMFLVNSITILDILKFGNNYYKTEWRLTNE